MYLMIALTVLSFVASAFLDVVASESLKVCSFFHCCVAIVNKL